LQDFLRLFRNYWAKAEDAAIISESCFLSYKINYGLYHSDIIAERTCNGGNMTVPETQNLFSKIQCEENGLIYNCDASSLKNSRLGASIALVLSVLSTLLTISPFYISYNSEGIVNLPFRLLLIYWFLMMSILFCCLTVAICYTLFIKPIKFLKMPWYLHNTHVTDYLLPVHFTLGYSWFFNLAAFLTSLLSCIIYTHILYHKSSLNRRSLIRHLTIRYSFMPSVMAVPVVNTNTIQVPLLQEESSV